MTPESRALASLLRRFLVLPETCLDFLPLDIIRKANFFHYILPILPKQFQKFQLPAAQASHTTALLPSFTSSVRPGVGTEVHLHMLTTPFLQPPLLCVLVSTHRHTQAQHLFPLASTLYTQISYLFVEM